MPINLHNIMSGGILIDYCRESGAQAVWQAWRDSMLRQYRTVSEERMNWSTLPDKDKSLDADIAYAVVKDFLEWLGTH